MTKRYTSMRAERFIRIAANLAGAAVFFLSFAFSPAHAAVLAQSDELAALEQQTVLLEGKLRAAERGAEGSRNRGELLRELAAMRERILSLAASLANPPGGAGGATSTPAGSQPLTPPAPDITAATTSRTEGARAAPSYSVSPTALMRGQTYAVTRTVSGAQPLSTVLYYLRSPSGIMRYNGVPMGKTNASGSFTSTGNQTVAATGETGVWTSWVRAGASESNQVTYTVSAPPPPAASGGSATTTRPTLSHLQNSAGGRNTLASGEQATIFGTGLPKNSVVTVVIGSISVGGQTNADGTQIGFTAPRMFPSQYRLYVQTAGGARTSEIELSFANADAPAANQPPLITEVAGPITVFAGERTTWTITASDPDGTTLYLTTETAGADFNYTDLPQTAPRGQRQTFTYSPAFMAPGEYSLILRIKDGAGTSASRSIPVTALPSKILVTIKNIALTEAEQTLAPGAARTLGRFELLVFGEPVTPEWVHIFVSGGTAAVTDIRLFDESGRDLGRTDGVLRPPAERITFPAGPHTYTIKGAVSESSANGSTFTIAVRPQTDWPRAVGAQTGRGVTMPTGFDIGPFRVMAPNLTYGAGWWSTDRANRRQLSGGKEVYRGETGVPMMDITLGGSGIAEDARIASIPIRYYFYAPGPNQVENCRLSENGAPLTSGGNALSPAASDPNGQADHLVTLDSPLIVPKGATKVITLSCDIAEGATGQFAFGATETSLLSATGVSSGVPIPVTQPVPGVLGRGVLLKVTETPPTSFIPAEFNTSGSWLAAVLRAVSALFRGGE